MRFTRLRLNGFKSFVDPTDMAIHEGLTGIVGPNGCGKSNLLEALRWVMGENRASAMRGGGMEDVIFNGAATRAARHFAEVALVIDNAERLAPSGFNDADQIEIVRRITRDAGSAFRANTKEVRARDVQMLFADASTGAHSPALVKQGQITELINAKPKARRMILEEAAGISGLYQRRHEAELRLTAADQNLVRVDDVLEALAQQLSALNRQAKQAARYREIGEELRRAEAMALYRRWREAEVARAEAEAVLRQRLGLTAQAEAATRAARVRREAAEHALPPAREEEAIAGAVLQRLTLQREALGEEEARAKETIATLTGRIAQLGRDLEREAGLNKDAGESIARLEWETEQLARASEGQEERLAAAAEAARAAAADLAGHEAQLSEAAEDAARLSARHHSAQRLLVDTETGVARAQGEVSRASAAVLATEATVLGSDAALTGAEAARVGALAQAEATEAALTAAESTRAQAQDRESEARAVRSAVEGETNAVRAEVAALQRLLSQESQAGQQMIDRLTVVPGFEAALGAALADDLRSAELGPGKRSGWAALPPYDAAQALPEGVMPLAAQVSAPAALARRLSQIGLVQASKGDGLQAALLPGQRLVSAEGDLWRWDGFKVAREDAPSATALRLKQLNRLAQLKRDLEELTHRAAGAAQAHDHLRVDLAEATKAETFARDARRAADQRLADTSRAASRAEADRSMARGRLETAALAVTRHGEDLAEARGRLAEAQAAITGLGDLDAARAAVEAVRGLVDLARTGMLARRSGHDELRREGEARLRRRQEAVKELSGWRLRLETAEKRSAELAGRRGEAEAELTAASAAPGVIAAKRAELAEALHVAEARRRKAADVLAEAEGALRAASAAEREADQAAGEARESRARAEARLEAARETVVLALSRMEEDSGASPEELLGTLKVDPDRIPDVAALDADIARLKRQREALGAVNLRAEEDAKTVEAEYDALVAEKVDLQEAIKKLRAGIAGLNREGRERLLTAFEQVNATFGQLFTHLFGGGEARLVLVESDDPLEAGLEIMCQPPGKRLSVLSLLSGGEQTLTALALIFGVFLTNPAPICVLDEVDAPLDDANVTRFCDLMDEMTRRTETRFLVITHHAVTMSRMDRLFGVTMAEQGVSQLVSVDLKRAAALVA